jgi:hypothetical protein
MPRTSLTAKAVVGGYGTYSADGADFTWTAADVANGNQVAATNNDLVLAYNSGATPYTVTISSVADPFNRTGDITTYSLAAGEYGVFGPFPNLGWKQSDGYLYLAASNASVRFAVIALG